MKGNENEQMDNHAGANRHIYYWNVMIHSGYKSRL